MMSLLNLSDYDTVKYHLLQGRYISSEMLNDVLLDLNKSVYVEVSEIGKSVEKKINFQY